MYSSRKWRSTYAEGVKSVKFYSQTEIILAIKNCALKIKGTGLRLEKFCGGDAMVKGRVQSIERISF